MTLTKSIWLLMPRWFTMPATVIYRVAAAIPWPVYALVVLLGSVWYYGHVRYESGQLSVQVRWDAERAQLHAIAERARAEAKAAKQARVKRGRAIIKKLRGDDAHGHAIRDSAVAGLRDGTFRLRERFSCPPNPAPARGAAARGNEGTARGLSAADAEFLVRFASDADDVARQLAACQAILSADRAQFAAPTRAAVVADRD
jgi:prophage endopeptidase